MIHAALWVASFLFMAFIAIRVLDLAIFLIFVLIGKPLQWLCSLGNAFSAWDERRAMRRMDRKRQLLGYS